MPKYDWKQVSQINNENIQYACAYRRNVLHSKPNLISLCRVQKFSSHWSFFILFCFVFKYYSCFLLESPTPHLYQNCARFFTPIPNYIIMSISSTLVNRIQIIPRAFFMSSQKDEKSHHDK